MATKGSRDCDKVDSIYEPYLIAFLALSVVPEQHASHAFPAALLFRKRQVNCFDTERRAEGN